MKAKTQPAEIWAEYQKALAYNSQDGIDLQETVRQNEDFYIGKQWEGLEAPDLQKPVVNILKRVVTFFISTIVSDDIAVSVTEFFGRPGFKQVLDMLSRMFGEVMELSSFKKKSREAVRDSAVDGDGCVHYYFDPQDVGSHDDGEKNGIEELVTPGSIQAEVLDNNNVFFGNPQVLDVQSQPYIIVQFRRFVGDVKEAAKENGVPADAANAIQPDSDEARLDDKADDGKKVTVLRKYYRIKGEVWYTEVTQSAVVKPPQRAGWRLYPVAWLPWERRKNSYHGVAAITSMIPNQIFINKTLAMAMEHVKRMAFPKVVYNKNLLPGGWTNKVGAAVGVNGPPNEVVSHNTNAADMSNQVLVMVEKMIQYTREAMGASDAALGNVKPDNTSAIIATQKATSMPLELQKMAFYQFVEDSVRIWMEMMGENYGQRQVEMSLPEDGNIFAVPGVVAVVDTMSGQLVSADTWMMQQAQSGPMGGSPDVQEDATVTVLFDFGSLKGKNLQLNVDIGASTYWSELMQVQTLDNLFSQGIIDDAELYLELVPAAYIPNKHIILDHVRKRKAAMQAAQLPQQTPGGMENEIPGAAGLPPEMTALLNGGVA